MTFNPLSATKEIQESYVNFYKTNFTLGNKELSDELDKLSENNHLWREPYISITQNYVPGKLRNELQSEINIDPDVIASIPINKFYKHQENAMRNLIKNERNTIVSSGTGSGKTESFLIPVLNECTKSEVTGLKAILIYPMNALANDQVDRLRDILFKLNKKRQAVGKRQITFGIYTGPTPSRVTKDGNSLHDSLSTLRYRCPSCGRNNALICKIEGGHGILTCGNVSDNVKIDFQLLSREELQNNPPDILITNYVMLERILLRANDKPLFAKNKVKYLVVDEIHAYGGARGVDVGLLLRRFRRRLWKDSLEKLNIICVGTSATMSKSQDQNIRKNKIAEFGSKLFGVKFTHDDVFEGEKIPWILPIPESLDEIVILNAPNSLDNYPLDDFRNLSNQISHQTVPDLKTTEEKSNFLGVQLCKNPFFQELVKNLSEPRSIEELRNLVRSNKLLQEKIKSNFDDKTLDELIWSYLKAGSLAKNPTMEGFDSLLKVSVHNFFRILPEIFRCSNPDCKAVYFTPKDVCEKCNKKIEELAVCRNCSEEFLVSKVSMDDISKETEKKINKDRQLAKLKKETHFDKFAKEKIDELFQNFEKKTIRRYPLNETNKELDELWFKIISEEQIKFISSKNDDERDTVYLKKCLDCGSFNPLSKKTCEAEIETKICGSEQLIVIETFPPKFSSVHKTWRPRDCPYCSFSYGSGWAVTKFDMTPKQAATNLFNIAYDQVQNHKLLIFTDSRQDAASLAGWLDFAHEDTALKQLLIQKLQGLVDEGRKEISYRELLFSKIMPTINDEWYNFNIEDFDRSYEEISKKILVEICDKKRLSLERIGLVEYNYKGLEKWDEFEKNWKAFIENCQFSGSPSSDVFKIIHLESNNSKALNNFIISILHRMRRNEAIDGLEKRDPSEKFYARGYEFINSTDKIDNLAGIKIDNLAAKKRNKFLDYTKKVFGIEDHDALVILDFVWGFVKKRGFVIEKNIMKFRNASKRAFVVSIDKLTLSIPTRIQKCDFCDECYTNLPDNKCSTIIRQKLCPGITKEIPYSEFLALKSDDHFFNLFKNGKPTRMITKEHTGALSDEEAKRIQDSFSAESQNERKVDVIVATPTLELGVDIGDLSSVGLYKSPPSAISYIQRVGRAGRRDGISFINTFFFNSPVDEFYYRHPQDLIKGYFYPPYINFENEELIKRHYNSLILEEIALSEHGDLLSIKVSEFLEKREENTKKILKLIDEKKDIISEAIRFVFNDIPDYKKKFEITDKILEYKNEFQNDFNDALNYFIEERNSSKRALNDYDLSGTLQVWDRIKVKELDARLTELNNKKLDNHLFDVNFLPRFAFPGKLVEIEITNGEFMHGGRPRNIAISEFAPNCEINFRKKIYKSIGIDPDKPAEYFNVCNNCMKFYSRNEIVGTTCPYCFKKIDKFPSLRSISPSKIYIREISKSITESSKYNEPKLDIFMPMPKKEPKRTTIPLESYDIELSKFGNTMLLLTVLEIFTEFSDPDEDSRESRYLEICEKCGRVKERSEVPTHKALNKKFSGKKETCTGKFLRASLHHEMPTNVISIKIKNKNDTKYVKEKQFLTTLKSALIYAGQSIAEAPEGEIEGIIKEDELILFDNIDGGAGYVDTIYERFNEVLQRAYQIIDEEKEIYKESCDKGCLRCLWSYRHKRDIPFINKQLILPLLQQCSLLQIESESNFKKKQPISKFNQIESNPNSLIAANFIKKILRQSKREIQIFTPIISTKKIEWDDERSKDWIDILGSLRTGSENITISMFIKNRTIQDEDALRRLLAYDIALYEVPDEFLETLSTSNESVIYIDPFATDTRQCLRISTSLTEQIVKDHTLVLFSNEDEVVNKIKKELENISSNSNKIDENDIHTIYDALIDVIIPNNRKVLEDAILNFNKFLSNAEKEIKIMDPYLQNKFSADEDLGFYIRYINQYLQKGVSIKIISTGHDKNTLRNLKTWIEPLGHKIDVVSYDSLGYYKNTRTLHDRFVIIDDKQVVDLGKGLTILSEYEKKGTLTNSIINRYDKNEKIVNKFLYLFEYFWNYNSCLDEKIKNWPKIDSRSFT